MNDLTKRIPDDLRSSITKMEGQFKLALPKHLPPDRFVRIVFTAVQRTPRLVECSRSSLLASVMRAAEQGLIPDGRQGALVPYRNKGTLEAQFIPMWQGLLDLARQSGAIEDAYVASVRENDDFDYELGLERKLRHKPALRDRGDILFVYAIVVLKGGTKTFGPGPMTVEEVEAIRARSRAKDSGPWVTDWEAMAWKTVLKRTLKYVPQSPELQTALYQDDDFDTTPAPKVVVKQDDSKDDLRRRIDTALRESGREDPDEDWPKDKALEHTPDGPPWRDDQGRWYTEVNGKREWYYPQWHTEAKDDLGRPKLNSDGSFRKRRYAKPVGDQNAEDNQARDLPDQVQDSPVQES